MTKHLKENSEDFTNFRTALYDLKKIPDWLGMFVLYDWSLHRLCLMWFQNIENAFVKKKNPFFGWACKLPLHLR